MRGQTVDRIQLHERFWDQADRFHRVEIYQKELAEELRVTQATMSLIIKDLVVEGRIKKIAAKKRNIGIYAVRDPSLYPHPFDPAVVPGVGITRCAKCGELDQLGKHIVL